MGNGMGICILNICGEKAYGQLARLSFDYPASYQWDGLLFVEDLWEGRKAMDGDVGILFAVL